MNPKATIKNPVCLIIMDGFGLDAPGPGNAISLANKPTLDKIFEQCPRTTLKACGAAVGLPDGQMGNSEVGHLNIGAGRVVNQELTRLNMACADGSLDENEVLCDAFNKACDPGKALHFMGLLSNGGVHSINTHLYALVQSAARQGVPEIYVHCFMDGRDVDPKSGLGFVQELESELSTLNTQSVHANIASISGRYYAMDRDSRWDRVKKAYDCVVCASPKSNLTPAEFMQASYDSNITDEFVVPGSFSDRGIKDGDSVVFFNFRPDRARQLTRALVDDNFDGFSVENRPCVNYVCLTEYDPNINAPIAFAKTFPKNVLADVIEANNLRQYHIAETEKYAHVTFFLNGGVEKPKRGEERRLIASPKVATYDLKPEMSCPEVTDALCEAINNDSADFYIVNFANCDMVGHTGSIPAAVAAVEATDTGVGRVLESLRKKNGIAFVTADHGNADKMLNPDGSPFTAHTLALVPFIAVDYSGRNCVLNTNTGALCDIAPTILDAMMLDKPDEMTGKSLIVK